MSETASWLEFDKMYDWTSNGESTSLYKKPEVPHTRYEVAGLITLFCGISLNKFHDPPPPLRTSARYVYSGSTFASKGTYLQAGQEVSSAGSVFKPKNVLETM